MSATGGQPGAVGSMGSVEVEWHLREVARAIQDPSTPTSPELFRIVLIGLAEIVRQTVDHRSQAPAQAPILFRDHIVSEAAHMWESRIREAMRAIADGQRRAEQGGEP